MIRRKDPIKDFNEIKNTKKEILYILKDSQKFISRRC